jgi:hypothetical protein
MLHNAWGGLAVLAAVLALGTTPAVAQLTTLAPSDALACLTPPTADRGEPEYPLIHLKDRTKGRVLATVTFTGTDIFPTPSITIETQEGGDEFVESVKKHLRTLRVPCLPRYSRADLRFEFLFNPDTRKVLWSPPTDLADPARSEQIKCIKGLEDDKPPQYPMNTRVQGRIWATARYVAPDQAPEVKLYHRPYAKVLAREVQDWLSLRRMPCLQGAPIQVDMTFIFKFEGDVYGFRPLSLVQYMGVVKGIHEQLLDFDTHSMGCPFELKLQYRQPDLPNGVGEVGERNPARRPLLEWLAQTQLDMGRAQLDAIYADTADIHVPCLNINLKPKESTS